jgi:hypothetical protein
MGRPYHPETGLNRTILLYVRRNPGTWPGTLSRVLGHDSSVVRGQLRRLVATEHLRAEDRDGHDWLYVTELGERALRRRRPPARGGNPWRATEGSRAVHS